MGDDIAHAKDLLPWHVRMTRFQGIAEPFGRFPDCQNAIGGGVLDIRILQERLAGHPCGLPFDTFDKLQDIQ